MTKKINVLFLSMYDPSDDSSGVGIHLRHLSQELHTLGCKVHILVLGKETITKDVAGVKVHYLKTPVKSFGQGVVFAFLSFGAVDKICLENKIDIVHGQSPSSFFYALFQRRQLPFVVTLHGTSFGELIHRFGALRVGLISDFIRNALIAQSMWALLTKIEYAKADRVIAVSNVMAQEAIAYYHLHRRKVVVIPNGVNVHNRGDAEKKTEWHNHTILFVGRMVWTKGVQYLVKAMPAILVEYPDAKLLLVGEGEYKTYLKAIVCSLGLEKSVFFLGKKERKALHSLYSEVGVYVQPSVYEGFGIPVIEAMSACVPVIVTRAVPDIVTNYETGLVVDCANVNQLSESVKKVFSDGPLRTKMVRNAKKVAENKFSWRLVASRTLKLYCDVVEKSSRNLPEQTVKA